MVMDTRNCRQVELGKSCTVSCSEGFTGDSTFTCQRDGVSMLRERPPHSHRQTAAAFPQT